MSVSAPPPWLFLALVSVSAADPADARFPADRLDLAAWRLTLPVDTDRPGRPDEIGTDALRTFADPRYFRLTPTAGDARAAGGGVLFRAPCGGATTRGSRFPRCELREMNPDTGRPADWSTDDPGTRVLTARLAILELPPVKRHVVCAQIHDPGDDLLMIRLEGTKLFVERNDTGDASLDRNYTLGTPFDLEIEGGGGEVVVRYNGAEKLRWAVSRDGCYFKAGCYTQSNPEKGDAADAAGAVVIYELGVRRGER